MKINILPALSLVCAALAASAADAPKADPAAAAYKSKCASCHAKDGTGNPAMAKMFKVTPAALSLVDAETLALKDEDLAKTVEAGKGKMPAFKGKLKDVATADLLAYIRGLAPKKAAKP